ncbi:MAG: hypothetical protein JO032_03450, partial [Alphaproteobacteria bacterium]|nr:hypothetical protein [Alphaproteobacteria bacterium]
PVMRDRRGEAKVERMGRLAAHVLYSTVFFMYNALVTAAFAEPDYRYHHMTILLKVVIAAYGVIALTWLARSAFDAVAGYYHCRPLSSSNEG